MNKNTKEYIKFLGTQNNFKFKNVNHEIKYSVNGVCPHCNKEIKTEEIEKFSDISNENPINYLKYIDKWKNKKKEHFPIISQTEWKTSHEVFGVCPYCNEFIESSYLCSVSRDNITPYEIIDNTKYIHTIIECPKCNKHIHSVGFKYDGVKERYYKWCTSEECKLLKFEDI